MSEKALLFAEGASVPALPFTEVFEQRNELSSSQFKKLVLLLCYSFSHKFKS